MMRKFVLAALMAVVLMAAPTADAASKPHSVSNINKKSASVPLAKDEANAPTDSASASPTVNDLAAQIPAQATAAPSLPEMSAGSNEALAHFGPSSGTVVGNRALELRDELLRLRSSVNLNAGEFALQRANGTAGAVQYHSTVAAITARLQNGTTRGNPILLRQWEEAEASLNEVTNSLNRLNSLQTAVSADASLASYLLESIQAAFQLSGAVDEDHDQLKLLRDEVSRLVVQLDYLRNQVADDIQRQTTYLTTERANLQTLAFAISRGELLGNNLGNRPVVVTPSPVATLPAPPVMAAPVPSVTPGQLGPAPMSPRDYMQESGGTLNVLPSPPPASNVGVAPSMGRLLVLIRFNQPTVEYEQQLAKAINTVLQREPAAEFGVVAVTPSSGDTSELATMKESAGRNAESVKRSLVQIGINPSRISVSNTQLASAQTPEVHIYVK